MALARGLRACVVVVIASASFALAQTNQQVCTAFVPAAGMDHTSNLNTSTNALLIGIPNPDTVAQQCGATWLVDRLRRFNATVFADYISQSNNDLAPVLDLVCTLPGGSCTQCTQAYAQMYAFLTTPAQPVSVYNFQNSTFFKLAQNIGYACGTTRNPYQVLMANDARVLLPIPMIQCPSGVSSFCEYQHCLQCVCPRLYQPGSMQQHCSQPAIWAVLVAVLPPGTKQPLPRRCVVVHATTMGE